MLEAMMAAAVLNSDLRPDLGWMSGYWLSCEADREVSEFWTAPRLDLMAGVNVTVRGERAGFEMSTIRPIRDAPDAPFAYFAQPDGAPPTIFPVIESGPDRVVFEQEDAHDFPRRIVYERAGDELLARIEGEIDGKTQTVRWRFQKAELNAACPARTEG